MKKVAVLLSGCGFLDGSEITEAVSALIALSEAGVSTHCFAPRLPFLTINHAAQIASGGDRDMFEESARISRGTISDIKDLEPEEFEALVIPGGFGAAKNLSTWAEHGARAKVNVDVERVIRAFHAQHKPIGAICTAPTLLAKVLGSEKPNLTIGNDRLTAAEIEKTGAHHVNCPVTDYVSDRDHKLLTTPAYMIDDAKPHEVFAGIRAMVRELVEMA